MEFKSLQICEELPGIAQRRAVTGAGQCWPGSGTGAAGAGTKMPTEKLLRTWAHHFCKALVSKGKQKRLPKIGFLEDNCAKH